MQKVFWGRAVYLAAALSITGCCGLLSQDDEQEIPVEAERTTRVSRKAEFAGSYKIEDPNYEDLKLEISKRGEYYLLEWIIPASEPWYAYGVSIDNYLAVSEGGEDATLAIYKLQGSKLSGLWCDGEEVQPFDMTSGAEGLEPSEKSFTGTYQGESTDEETGENYTYTLKLRRSGDCYQAEEEFTDGVTASGFGFALDDMLIVGFPIGGSMVVKFYRMKGSRLDGKYFFSYFDDEEMVERVVVGKEKASRQ